MQDILIDYYGLIFTDTSPWFDLSVMTYFWLIHPNFEKLRDISC